ncbi:probable inorganic phosphate transporter 1-3 [Coccomyxa sp. Obi]|nr:probable inorganic phosphate transporter 1-3 [Coccomyxa sp. Obi]
MRRGTLGGLTMGDSHGEVPNASGHGNQVQSLNVDAPAQLTDAGHTHIEVPNDADGHGSQAQDLNVEAPAKKVSDAGADGFDRSSMAGNAVESYEDQDVPFFWFHSFKEFWFWLIEWAIPGLGMFCEAYFIFSIGNVRPIITDEYPNCWKIYRECSKTLTEAPDYTQIIGIILGMCTMGIIGDKIGRKWGSVTTASIMTLGAIVLTCTNGASTKGFTVMYLISQLVFGFGVGGEYPMAAGSAAERAEAGGREMAKKRGREVVLTFSMQGVGNFVNTAVLCILVVIYGVIKPNRHNKLYPYHPRRLDGVWRTAFGLGIGVLLFIVFWGIYKLHESAVWKADRRAGSDSFRKIALLFKVFWSRLLATAGSWFLWDFSFYGNKVFQSTFIQILSPGASLLTTLLWTLLNSGCALVGYYVTAGLVDNPKVGRLRIQIFGFAMVGTLFMISAACYHPLTTRGGLGELYPMGCRTTAHGISAGTAKVGALWAAVWFNYLPPRTKFWITASFNFGGMLLTALFMPDPLRLSLSELDRWWNDILNGRQYHGQAINPKNLSIFERIIGVGKYYDPKEDLELMQREKAPDWRIASMERVSNNAAPSAV